MQRWAMPSGARRPMMAEDVELPEIKSRWKSRGRTWREVYKLVDR